MHCTVNSGLFKYFTLKQEYKVIQGNNIKL